jgi:PAS domain S-box-containing protein
MSIRIQTRILLVLAGLAVLFLGVMTLNWQHQRSRIYSLLHEREGEKGVLFDRIDGLLSSSLKTFDYDYSYWDEMCDFAHNGDEAWADENIVEGMKTYEAHAAWVYRKNLTCLYATNNLHSDALPQLPLGAKELDSLLSKTPFNHFYVRHEIGLLEVFSAPIQPSNDSLRRSAPQGYLFVARWWSPQRLEDLGLLMGGTSQIAAPSDLDSLSSHDIHTFTTTNTVPLPGWDGRPVVRLLTVCKNPSLQASYEEARSNFLAGIGFVAALMLVSTLVLFRTVTTPLQRISRSLREQQPWLIEDLQRSNTEFAGLATLILDFFRQRQLLQTEIDQRRESEAALRASETLLQATIESTGDGFLVIDGNGKVSRCNRRFAELWSIPQELLAERDDAKLIQFILEQLVDPEAFLEKVQRLYQSEAEDFDTLAFKDGRIFERYSFPLMMNGVVSGRVWNFRDVTKSKEAEHELRRSNDLLAALVDTAPLPIWTVDLQGKIDKIWNPAAEQMLGWRKAEVQGKFNPAITEDQMEKLKTSLESMQKGKSVYDLELKPCTLDGGILTASYNSTPLWDASGNVTGAVVIMMDLTERKLAEQAMRESEERFRNLSDSAPVLIWMAGVDRHCYYFNRTWRSFTGRSLQSEYGKGWLDGVHPDDRSGCLDTYRAAFTAQRPFTTEFRLRHMDGTYHSLMDTGVPRFAADGRFTGFIGTSTDITDWKGSEDALRASEERFRSVFETMPDALFLKNCEREYTFVNPVTERLLGLAAARLIGRTDDELMPSPVADVIRDSDRRVLAGETVQIELPHVADGEALVLHVLKVPLRDRRGAITGICGAVRDITGRRRMEEALAAERQLFVGGPTVVFKWRVAENWPVAYVSPNVKSQLGYSPEELIDGPFTYESLIHPEDVARMRPELEARLESGAAFYEMEYRLRHADGTYRWVYDFTVPNHVDENGMRYHHGYIVDITERKQTARALLDQALRYRAITEAAPYAMVISRLPDGQVLYANDRFCRQFGVEPDDLSGMNAADFLSNPVMREQALSILKSVGCVDDMEMEATHRDGTTLRMRIAAHVFEFDGVPAVLTVMYQVEGVPGGAETVPTDHRASMSHHLQLLNRELESALASAGSYLQRPAAGRHAEQM